MRKLIYLLIVGGAAYFLYQNWSEVQANLKKYEPEIFNALPDSLRKVVFSGEVPKEFRGSYLADQGANAYWLRHQFPTNPPKPTGKTQVDLDAKTLYLQVRGGADVIPVEVVQKGDGFIVVEHKAQGEEPKRYMIEREGNGIWVYFEDIAPGYKERYRKVK